MKSCPHPTSQRAAEELPCFVMEMTTSILSLPNGDLSAADKYACAPLRLAGEEGPGHASCQCRGKQCPPHACLWFTAANNFTQHTDTCNMGAWENLLLCKTGSRDYCLAQATWALVSGSVQRLSLCCLCPSLFNV